MGDRKQPKQPPAGTCKPAPPPAPPARKTTLDQAVEAIADALGGSSVKVKTSYAECTIISTAPMVCPLCGSQVVAMKRHTCTSRR